MRLLKTFYSKELDTKLGIGLGFCDLTREEYLDKLRDYYITCASEYLPSVKCYIDSEKVLTRIKKGDSIDLSIGKIIAYIVNSSNERIGHLLLVKLHFCEPICQILIDTKRIK